MEEKRNLPGKLKGVQNSPFKISTTNVKAHSCQKPTFRTENNKNDFLNKKILSQKKKLTIH